MGKHRTRMHDVDQLWFAQGVKSRLIEDSGNISSMNQIQSGSGVHVFALAFEHTEDILNTDFSCV